MNRAIRVISIGFLVMFVLLLGNANYVQVFNTDKLNAGPGNNRTLIDAYKQERGPILVGGKPIAWSKNTGGLYAYERQYSEDIRNYAQLVGYFSMTYGKTGLERQYNDFLNGTDDRLFVRRVMDMFADKQPKGGSVQLTLNAKAQQAAAKGLGNNRGAVAAIEPSTGRVLAMVSRPTWDPSDLASHEGSTQRKSWEQYTEDDSNPMENRAAGRRYPPGSTFKLLTAAAALESGKYDENTQIDSPKSVQMPLSKNSINNEWGGSCNGGRTDLEKALEVSCNTAFANVGQNLGDDELREQAEKFGFAGTEKQAGSDEKNPLKDYGGASSVFPYEADKAQTMLSAIGQYDVQATPLQVAMMSAAVANDGEVMKPYITELLRAPDSKPVERTSEQRQSRAMSARNANLLTDMMVNVVDNGTGTNGQIDGTKVAGKTGTAQTTPDQPPYAWFTSFAPADDPKVAVAVVIEQADVARSEIAGGRLAAPIAKDVMEAVIND